MICPCCNRSLDDALDPRSLVEIDLPRVQQRIVESLASAYPRRVSSDALLMNVYRDVEEPENALTSLLVTLGNLRKRLPAYGWTISMGGGGNGHIGRYKLEPVI